MSNTKVTSEDITKKIEEYKIVTEEHLNYWCVGMVLPQINGRYIPLGESRVHVIQIGAKLLTHTWFGSRMYPPGSFIKSLLENDLQESYMRADDVNVNMIPFYTSLMYNYGRNVFVLSTEQA